MTEQDHQISELEAENFRLRSMLARHGVSVLPSPDLPNAKELAALVTMIELAYPRLRAPQGNSDAIGEADRRQIIGALRWLAYVYKSHRLATDRATSYWFGCYKEWMSSQGYSDTTMNLRPLCIAAIAQCVAFSSIDLTFPYVSLGLTTGTTDQPRAEWRETLSTARRRRPKIKSPIKSGNITGPDDEIQRPGNSSHR